MVKKCLNTKNNPFKFEKNYHIIDEELVVIENKKEHKYKINKTKIKYYENILEKQYQSIIKNQNQIMQNKTDIRIAIYCPIAMILCVLSAILSDFSNSLAIALFSSSAITLIINSIDNAIFSYTFRSKVKTYESFMKERKEIEEYSENDKSITDHLSDKTRTILQQNQNLKEQNLIDNIYNINFMDKAKLKELNKILYIYSINTSYKEYIIKNNPSLNLFDKVNKIKKRTKKDRGFSIGGI